jgi:hypothetical protein
MRKSARKNRPKTPGSRKQGTRANPSLGSAKAIGGAMVGFIESMTESTGDQWSLAKLGQVLLGQSGTAWMCNDGPFPNGMTGARFHEGSGVVVYFGLHEGKQTAMAWVPKKGGEPPRCVTVTIEEGELLCPFRNSAEANRTVVREEKERCKTCPHPCDGKGDGPCEADRG